MRRVALLASAGVFSCFAGLAAQQPAGGAGAPAAAVSQPRPIVTVRDLMQGIIIPSSDVVWGSVKIEVTGKGWQDVYPQTEEEWEPVRKAAIALAESGNLLMMRGRRGSRDKEQAWMDMAKQLSDGGANAIKAAQARDPKMFTDASEQIRYSCFKCHLDFAPRRDRDSPVEPF